MHSPFGSLRHVTAIINHGLFFNFQMVGGACLRFGLLAKVIQNDRPIMVISMWEEWQFKVV